MVKLLSDQSTVAKGSHWQVRKGQGWGRGGRTETVARGLHWQMRRGWPGGGRGGRGLKAHWRMSRSEGAPGRGRKGARQSAAERGTWLKTKPHLTLTHTTPFRS